MQSWQERVWTKWLNEMIRDLPEGLKADLRLWPPAQSRLWALRLSRPVRSAIPGLIRDWLREPDDKPWILVPGLDWEMAEMPSSVLLTVPEALTDDPVAMAAMGLVRAECDPNRLRAMAQTLGPALVPVIQAGQWGSATVNGFGSAWLQTYRDRANQAGDDWTVFCRERFAECEPASATWPVWPETANVYREQLAMGIVPHEAGGKSPDDPLAILLALSAIPSDQRVPAAALAGKALLGQVLGIRWQKFEEEAVGHGRR